MIKRTLFFENPAYLSVKNSQLMIKIPEVENNEAFSDYLKKNIQRLFLLKISVLLY